MFWRVCDSEEWIAGICIDIWYCDYVCDGNCLSLRMKLEDTRDDVEANIKVHDITIDCSNENRLSRGRAECSRDASFSANWAADGPRFDSNILHTQISFSSDIAKAFILHLIRECRYFLKLASYSIFDNFIISVSIWSLLETFDRVDTDMTSVGSHYSRISLVKRCYCCYFSFFLSLTSHVQPSFRAHRHICLNFLGVKHPQRSICTPR